MKKLSSLAAIKLVFLALVLMVTGCKPAEHMEGAEALKASKKTSGVDLAGAAEIYGVSVRLVFKETSLEAEAYQNEGDLPDSILVHLQDIRRADREGSIVLHRESNNSKHYSAQLDPGKIFSGRWQISVMPVRKHWRLAGLATIAAEKPFWLKAQSAKMPKMPYHQSS